MPFEVNDTPIEGVKVIQPRVFSDPRGFFMETYKNTDFEEFGIKDSFVQDNHSHSCKGVLRGLHFQSFPHAQGKLVRVVKGSVWDVAVDIRPDSPTYKQWFGITLSELNHTMFYIPPGLAHGFITLEDETHFLYKCTALYAPESDGGIRWDDPDINIKWPYDGSPLVSDKDEVLPYLKELSL